MNYEFILHETLRALTEEQDKLAGFILNGQFVRNQNGVLDAPSIALEYVRLVANLQGISNSINILKSVVAKAQAATRPVTSPSSTPETQSQGVDNAGNQTPGVDGD